jgi:uncharacterized protein with PQ loop repeat
MMNSSSALPTATAPMDPCAMPTVEDIVVGSILFAGVSAAYLPQVIEIAWRASNVGVSGLFVVFALLAAIFTAMNAVIDFWTEIMCCNSVSVGQCIAVNLPFAQLIAPLLYQFLVLYVYAKYSVPVDGVISETVASRNRNYGYAALGASALLSLAVYVTPLLLYIDGRGSAHEYSLYSIACGYIGGIFAVLTFLPQIRETYLLKRHGSLSIPALVVMFVGNIILVVYLLLNGGSISLISQNAVAAVEIGVLLGMIVFYALKRWKARKYNNANGNANASLINGVVADSESSPLLSGGEQKH